MEAILIELWQVHNYPYNVNSKNFHKHRHEKSRVALLKRHGDCTVRGVSCGTSMFNLAIVICYRNWKAYF